MGRTKGNISSVHPGRYNTSSTVKIEAELRVTAVVCIQVGTIHNYSEDKNRSKGNISVHPGGYNTNSTLKIEAELKVTAVVCIQVGTIQTPQ